MFRFIALILMVMPITGCALLPGLNLDIDGEQRSSHYQPPGRDGGLVANYSPIVQLITPELILEQKRAQSVSNAISTATSGADIDNYDGKDPYLIGPGDSLGIIVYGQPDLTNPTGTTQSPESTGRLVDATGHIFFPYVGDLRVAGKTTREVRKEIRTKLEKFYRKPQVDVRIVHYRSRLVRIVGDISQPCAIPITELGLTVTDALAQCTTLKPELGGGSQLNASRSVSLVRSGVTTDLDSARSRGDGRELFLKAGDRLVIDNRYNQVFLLGEFEQQSILPMSAGGITLTDALVAGGPSIDTIDASAIYVIRGFAAASADTGNSDLITARPRIYHLNADYASGLLLANQFELKPRDIVYAAPAALVNFNRALGQVTPLLNTLFQTAIIYDRTRTD